MNTTTLPMHTLTFQAPNGYQETYHCWSWDDFHAAHKAMEKAGMKRVGWIDRSV